MEVRARWTVDIGLDSSVVEHLTIDAGVPGSIPGPAIFFQMYFFVLVHSSHPNYIWSSISRSINANSIQSIN